MHDRRGRVVLAGSALEASRLPVLLCSGESPGADFAYPRFPHRHSQWAVSTPRSTRRSITSSRRLQRCAAAFRRPPRIVRTPSAHTRNEHVSRRNLAFHPAQRPLSHPTDDLCVPAPDGRSGVASAALRGDVGARESGRRAGRLWVVAARVPTNRSRETHSGEPPPPLCAAEKPRMVAPVLGVLARVPRASHRWLGDAQAPRRTFSIAR